MKLWWCFASSFLSLSLNAQTPPPQPASDAAPAAKPMVPPGKPKGTAKTPAQGEVTHIEDNEVKAVVLTLPDCASYSATPLDSPLLFRGKTLYFASPKLPTDAGAATSYLIEADLTEGKAKRVAGFKSGKTVSLLAHDKEALAITILDFTKGRPDCGEGLTSGAAMRPAEQKVSPSYASGRYGLVAGESLANLAELDKGLIQALDLATSQKRTLVSFPPGTRPQYLKVSPPIALYNYYPQKKELSKFVANRKVADATLKLKEGMRLVRSGDRFGIAQAKGSDLQILQLKDWTGPEMKSTSLDLPAGFQAATVAIKANFAADDYLVMGKDEAARKGLKSVVHYSGKERKIFKAPDEKSYFSAAEFTPDGSVVMLLNEVDSDVVRELWVVSGGAAPQKIDVLKAKKAGSAKK